MTHPIPKNWRYVPLREIADISSGGTPSRSNPTYWNGSVPWVTTSEVNFGTIFDTSEKISEAGLKHSSAKLFPVNTLLMAMYGQGITRGKTALLGIVAATNQACAAIKIKKENNPRFFFQYLSREYENIRKLSNDGAQKNLSLGLIKSIRVPLPEPSEQNRIVLVLETWDKTIEKLQKRVELKKRVKKSLIQKLATGTTRLPGCKEPWKFVRLAEVLHEHKEKSSGAEEVHSVSVHKGVVNQIEHLGRSFSAANTDHYGLVKPGDIVYTKSPTGEFPLGIIKQSKLQKCAIVSPLYGIFTPETYDLGVILNAYFESPVNTTNYLNPIVRKGAKNTISITNSTFLSNGLKLPRDKKEQREIAKIISTAEMEVKTLEQKLENLKQQKRFLQEALVTGRIRTPENMPIPKS